MWDIHFPATEHRVIYLKPYSRCDSLNELIVEAEYVVGVFFKHLIDVAAKIVRRSVMVFFVLVSLSKPSGVRNSCDPVKHISVVWVRRERLVFTA
jgi:hypothetical protein